MKNIKIKGTKEEVLDIIKRISEENPDMTIEEYLKKYNKEEMILE